MQSATDTKGPSWVLRAIWSGDLVSHPQAGSGCAARRAADIIQNRKKELSVKETGRQLAAYWKLAEALPNGVLIDANKPYSKLSKLLTTSYSTFTSRATLSSPKIRESHVRLSQLKGNL
jgi:hypothetical protein